MGFAPKDCAISTNDGLICLTPAREFKIIIHIAKSVVVMTMDFNPKPNRIIKTGTSAVKGALRNTLTQGRSSSSMSWFLPIRIPTGMPTVTAKKVPKKKACPVSLNAFINGFVVIISDRESAIVQSITLLRFQSCNYFKII